MLTTLLASNKQLAKMLIKAQKEVFSKIAGEHNSRHKGAGYDFVELREYESGDDIRYIDWIISSKIGRPHVKVFHQQRELNVAIAAVLCGSVHFGTKRLKHELINEVCALVAYSCIRQNNPFESFICNDEVVLNTPKTKQLFGVRMLAEKIAEYKVLGKDADWALIPRKLFARLRQRSLVFLIGDFFDTQVLDLRALGMKHEVILIIVRDRFEERPELLGELNIIDPSSGVSSVVNLNKTAAETISSKVRQNDEVLYASLKRSGIKHVKIYTDEDPAEKILGLMRRP